MFVPLPVAPSRLEVRWHREQREVGCGPLEDKESWVNVTDSSEWLSLSSPTRSTF